MGANPTPNNSVPSSKGRDTRASEDEEEYENEDELDSKATDPNALKRAQQPL
jgi:hypothetical protein